MDASVRLVRSLEYTNHGFKFFNDTAATAPDAAMAAIKTIFEQLKMENKKGGVILIAGGADKNLNFSQLADLIAENCRAVVLLAGTATGKLEKEIDRRLPTKKVDNMEKAVVLAAKAAKPADIVLLSPGCASFGLFRHEFERGEAFNNAVALLKNQNAKIKIQNDNVKLKI